MTIDIDELRNDAKTAHFGHTPLEVPGSEMLELLDRLEAAESEALEEARLNGMGSEREAALLAKLEAAKKDRANFLVEMGRLCAQCDALRAKIKQMEKQEPVGEIRRANSTGNYINPVVWVPMAVGAKLYAGPGAKGEEK